MPKSEEVNTKLEELNKVYKQYRESGYSRCDSALESVNMVFSDYSVKPHIYLDIQYDPSHLFFGDSVYFFTEGDIYTHQK